MIVLLAVTYPCLWTTSIMSTELTPEQKLYQAAQETLNALGNAYTLMNSYANGEHMKLWAKVDHQLILGEIYFMLADPYNHLLEALQQIQQEIEA